MLLTTYVGEFKQLSAPAADMQDRAVDVPRTRGHGHDAKTVQNHEVYRLSEKCGT